jgi:serine/threonine protein kinase
MSQGLILANRFEVVRRLGSGGMGEVHEAYDRRLNDRVAIKKLPSLSPKALLLFKREFRSLQDFGHPNVVKLGELFEVEGEWFFSMELVQGCDLLTYIRGGSSSTPAASAEALPPTRPAGASSSASSSESASASNSESAGASSGESAGEPAGDGTREDGQPTGGGDPGDHHYDESRLRSAIAQLADALAALHGAGKIHRDIKPTNVLVGADGRVVLLDFGLIVDHGRRSHASTLNIAGTPEYMAPEQAAMSGPITPAVDCYSLGVILFQALTGRLPFEGAIPYLIYAKTVLRAPDVRELCPGCPPDLAEVCMAMLERDPASRMTASAVQARIRPAPTAPAAPTEAAVAAAPAPQPWSLVGREAEIGGLTDALAEVRRGELTSVVVQGESGIGKSSLVRRFLDDYRGSDFNVVLTGRCYEKESLPFKAFDEIVDSLSSYLRRQPKLEVAELIPRYIAYLRMLFPVIGMVPGFDKSYGPWEVTDPYELRHRAVSALREIFSSLGERRTVIVHIDDFQWADQDSMFLLSKLLGRPDPPRMLLLATSRQPVDLGSLGIGGAIRTVELGPLNRDSARLLAHQVLDASMPEVDPAGFDTLLEEAHGHPYFITELVRHIQRAADRPGARLDLDEAIWTRAAHEDAAALRILKYVCVAGVPIAAHMLQQVVQEPPARFQAYCNDLTREGLIRTTDSMLVPYHDRVREAVVKRLAIDELQALHAGLATVFEGHPDLALLVRHLEASGQYERAAQMATAAARKAREGLAFEQSVMLYRHRLRLGATTSAERCELLIELGATLAAMGKGLEASEVYIEAAEHADPPTRLMCNIQVAHQLLSSGYVQRGLLKIRDLFAEQGLIYPRTPTDALVRIVRNRISLSFRRLRELPRRHREPTANDQAQIALYKVAIQGLLLVDPLRAAFWMGQGLLLARQVGDRQSYMYFLLLEGDLRKSESSHQRAGAAVIAAFDDLLAQRPDDLPPSIIAVHKGAHTYMNIRGGDVDALEVLLKADETLSATRIAPWELVGGRTFLLLLLRRLGRYSDLRRTFADYATDAQRRNDVYTQETTRGFCNLLYLVDDAPERARDELASSIWVSFEHGFHVQHWYDFNALMELHIYTGEPPSADHVDRQLAAIKSSHLDRLAVFAAETEWLVGRLALAFRGLERFGATRVRKAIRRLERTSAPYPRLLATQLRAGLAHSEGDHDEAAAQLRNAIQFGKGLDMRIQPAVAGYQLGRLTGSEVMRDRAAATLVSEGVRNVARFADLLMPGFSTTTGAVRRP